MENPIKLKGHRSYHAPKRARELLDYLGLMPEGSMEKDEHQIDERDLQFDTRFQLKGHRSYNAPKRARELLDYLGLMPEGSMEKDEHKVETSVEDRDCRIVD